MSRCKTPKVSVIIPVYNTQEYVGCCLDSVLGQSLQNIEVICVDDGSTDNSLKILKEYASSDNRLKVITQGKNTGPGSARNQGLLIAKGEYISFMDSDDQYPKKETLEKLVQAIKEYGCKIAGGYLQRLKGNEILNAGSRVYNIIKQNPNGCLEKYTKVQISLNYYCYLFSRELLIKENIFFPDYFWFEDPPFFVRAMCKAGVVYLVPDATYLQRVGYKTIAWNQRKIEDLIRGNIDTLSLAKANNLQVLYDDAVSHFESTYKRVVLQNLSLEGLELYTLLVKLSTIKSPKNRNSRRLTQIMHQAEDKLSVLISAQYEKDPNWLLSLLENIKSRYLDVCPEREDAIDCSLLRVLRGISKSGTPYQARVMLKECVASSRYQMLGLQKHKEN